MQVSDDKYLADEQRRWEELSPREQILETVKGLARSVHSEFCGSECQPYGVCVEQEAAEVAELLDEVVAAAEQRVKSDFAKYLRHMVDDDKFGAGVKAARDAVEAMRFNPLSRDQGPNATKRQALAAIDGVEKP